MYVRLIDHQVNNPVTVAKLTRSVKPLTAPVFTFTKLSKLNELVTTTAMIGRPCFVQ